MYGYLVSGTTPSTFQVTSASGILVTLGVGAYKVSEESFLGFDASFSADCTGSLAPADQKTCTVTNAAPDKNSTITVLLIFRQLMTN